MTKRKVRIISFSQGKYNPTDSYNMCTNVNFLSEDNSLMLVYFKFFIYALLWFGGGEESNIQESSFSILHSLQAAGQPPNCYLFG